MHTLHRLGTLALAAAVGFGGYAFVATVAPAAARADCASNANIWQVHRHLDGAIDQLGHDGHDYGGHRVNAIADLQRARGELVAAEQYAIEHDRENPGCVRAHGPTGGSDRTWGTRAQRGSNANIAQVGRWVERMSDQLQRDQHDYDGHRVAAICDLQNARGELAEAERYVGARRY